VSARVVWVVVATVVSNLLRVVLTTAVSRRLLPALRLRLASFHWMTARQLFSFGAWTTLNQLAAMLYINADIIVLNKLASSSDVVVYKLGLEAYSQLNALVVAALVSILPVLTSLHTRSDSRRMGEGVLRGARYILWMSSFMILPLIVFRREVISLYAGENYLDAANVLTLLLLLFPFMAASFFLAPLSQARAELRGLCIANLVTQLVRLSAVLYAVKVLSLGAIGSALATFIVMTLTHSLILVPMTLRMANVGWQRYVKEVLAKGVTPALSGTLVWLALRSWVGPASWLSLAFCGSIGAVAYVAALVAFSLSAHERSDLLSAFRALGKKTFLKEPGFSQAGS
jgi:membrane protein EpsK